MNALLKLNIPNEKKIELAKCLMMQYYHNHYINYICAYINPTPLSIYNTFSFADHMLYELEAAEDALYYEFVDIDKAILDISQELKSLDENVEPIEKTKDIDNLLINNYMMLYAYRIKMDYMLHKIDDVNRFVNNRIEFIPFYDKLTKDSKRKYVERILSMLE